MKSFANADKLSAITDNVFDKKSNVSRLQLVIKNKDIVIHWFFVKGDGCVKEFCKNDFYRSRTFLGGDKKLLNLKFYIIVMKIVQVFTYIW